MTFNVIVAFRFTDIVAIKQKRPIFCLDSSLVQKILFLVNHLTMLIMFALTSVVTIIMFVFVTLKGLCTDGSNALNIPPEDAFKKGFAPGEIGQFLDLREYSPLIYLRTNETQFLYFKDDRLKMFCDDYVSMLFLYNLFYFISSLVMFYSIYNIIMVSSINLSRYLCTNKLQEIYSLNAHEMQAFT